VEALLAADDGQWHLIRTRLQHLQSSQAVPLSSRTEHHGSWSFKI